MNRNKLRDLRRSNDARYLEHIQTAASSREVAERLGMTGCQIGGVGGKLSKLVRRGLAEFNDGKFRVRVADNKGQAHHDR